MQQKLPFVHPSLLKCFWITQAIKFWFWLRPFRTSRWWNKTKSLMILTIQFGYVYKIVFCFTSALRAMFRQKQSNANKSNLIGAPNALYIFVVVATCKNVQVPNPIHQIVWTCQCDMWLLVPLTAHRHTHKQKDDAQMQTHPTIMFNNVTSKASIRTI